MGLDHVHILRSKHLYTNSSAGPRSLLWSVAIFRTWSPAQVTTHFGLLYKKISCRKRTVCSWTSWCFCPRPCTLAAATFTQCRHCLRPCAVAGCFQVKVPDCQLGNWFAALATVCTQPVPMNLFGQVTNFRRRRCKCSEASCLGKLLGTNVGKLILGVPGMARGILKLTIPGRMVCGTCAILQVTLCHWGHVSFS